MRNQIPATIINQIPTPVINQSSTSREIIAFIHAEAESQRHVEGGTQATWDCCTREEQVHPEYAAKRKSWANAAREGNWGKIFEIIASNSYDLSRFANVTRLLPIGTVYDPTRSPSGYTVLHQAAYMRASDEIIEALIALGCFRQLRTLDGKAQRPTDIAKERGFKDIAKLLEPGPDLIPQISHADMLKIQEHFTELVKRTRLFKPDEMRVVDLTVLREVNKVYMPVPGMYGGFSAHFEGENLVVNSWCRVWGGSGKTSHITPDGVKLVAEGW